MNIVERLSNDSTKIYYTLEWGRGPGERAATGIFTYVRPVNQIQKNHNKEALILLETKKSQLLLETQATGSGFIPNHKFKGNFLDYYAEYVRDNKKKGNRHLEGSLKHFRTFLRKSFISPSDITENLCERFRHYLLTNFNGDTPANYFSRFKKVLKSATKDGYYRYSPAEDLAAKAKKNRKLKEHLEADEYIKLLRTPCVHEEVREAFIFCCYTALRWCDVEPLDWAYINGDQLKTRIIQEKTGEPLTITLHPVALKILERRKARLPVGTKNGKVYKLPSADGANKILQKWCANAGIDKHITWHCARLSFSILLQDKNVDTATVALLLGHTTTKHVLATYKRHRPKDQTEAISHLPEYQLN